MLLAASGVAAGGIFVRALMARMVEPDRTHVASFSVGPADVPPVVPPSDPLADIDRLPPLSPVSSVAHLPNTDFVTQEFVNQLAAARMAHEAGNLPGTDLTPSLDDLSGDAGDAPDMDRPLSADGLGHGGGGGGGGSASASGPEDAGVGAAIGGPHSGSPGVNLEDLPPANLLPNMPGSALSAPTTLAGESSSPSPSVPPPTPTVTPQMLASLPMVFEPNVGQVADRTQQFVAHGADSTLYLSANAATLVLQPSGPGAVNPASPDSPPPTVSATPLAVQMQFVGASSSAAGVGSGLLSSYTNYFLGNDPSQWYTNVANYSQVTFANAYSGIDLVYQSGSSGPLEYSLIVHPGADPSQVKLAFSGVQGMQLDSQGNLLLTTADGTVEEQAPVLYQDINGVRQSVSGSFVLNADGTVGITVGAYDHTQTLTIDPQIGYATYLGGSGTEIGGSIAVDSSGDVYVAGYTNSNNFPTSSGAFQSSYGPAGYVAYVAKLSPTGSLLYSTYLGGSNSNNYALGIAVDSSGNAFITGETSATNFPTMSAYQSVKNGTNNAFVTELNSSGSALVYSTYLGGSGNSGGTGIALDSSDDAYVTGKTTSSTFPTQNALLSSFTGSQAAFVLELKPSGTGLDFSTFLGGNGTTTGAGIAVTTSGTIASVYVDGTTSASNFPTDNAIYSSYQATVQDGFVTKFQYNSSSNALSYSYSTYLGGLYNTSPYAIAVDSSGRAYVIGTTDHIPLVDPMQTTGGGFLLRINAGGTAYDYSTLLGGDPGVAGAHDLPFGIALDSSDNVYLVGATDDPNFVTVDAQQSTLNGGSDAWVAKIANPASSSSPPAYMYSSYYGGSSGETYDGIKGFGIALDSADNPIVIGTTSSSDLPGAANSYGGGASDAFVTKFVGLPTTAATVSIQATTNTASELTGTSGVFTVTRSGGDTNQPLTVYYSMSGTASNGFDYDFLPGSVVIPAGQTTATFNVVPLSSELRTGTQTAIATITNNPSYLTGSPSSDTVTITDSNTLAESSQYPDPNQGYLAPPSNSTTLALLNYYTGSVTASVQLCPCSLVYQSSTVNVKPIIVGTFASDSTKTLASLQTELIFNGTNYGWVSYGVGSGAGSYLLSSQVGTAITATGNYNWSLEVKATYTDTTVSDVTYSGVDPVVVNDNAGNNFGPGWWLAALSYLIISPNQVTVVQNGAATETFLDPPTGYTSPPNDFGTLVKNSDGSYTYTALDQTQDNYNSSGQLTTEVDSDGLTTTYAYSGTELTSITDPGGAVTTYNYSGSPTPLLSSIIEPGNLTYTLSRNASGDLTTVTDPAGGVETFTYDGSNRLTNEQDGPLNTTYTYNSSTNVLTQVDAGGAITTITAQVTQGLATMTAASLSANVAVVTDPNHQTTTYTFDSLGRLTKEQTPDGGTQTWKLNSAGNPVSYTDELGRTTTYAYDATGDVTQITNPDGSTESFQYQLANPGSTAVSLTGAVNTSGIYADGSTFSAAGGIDGNGNAYSYNLLGSVLNYNGVNYDLGPAGSDDVVAGTGQTITLPAGHYTALDLLATGVNGNQTSQTFTVTYTDGSTATFTQSLSSWTSPQSYTGESTVLTMSYQDTSGGGETAGSTYVYGYSFTLDPVKQVQSITLPNNANVVVLAMTLTNPAYPFVTQDKDTLGNLTKYAYNTSGDLTLSRDPLGNVTTMAYSNGLLTAVTDPRGETTTYAYNSQLLLTTTTDALGDVSTYAYNSALDLTAATDPRGNTTTYAYDGMGRTTAITDPTGGVETMTYDAAGDLLSDIDPLGHTTTYAYNMQGELTKITDAANEVSTMAYDLAGNLTASTDPNGNTTTYAYDSMDRVTTQTDPDGGVTTFAYDKDSELTAETDPNGATTTFAYNTRGWLTATTDALGGIATTAYDSEGDVTGTIDADGNRTTYAYDADQQLTKITDALGHVSTMLYDADGNVTVSTDADGHTTKYAYNAIDELTTTTDAANDVSTLAYDRDGNVTASTDPLGHTTTYAYDSMDRETATTDPLGNVTTTAYDLASNVTKTVDPLGNVTTYAYNAVDELTKTTDATGGVSTLAYDKDGNVTASTDENGHTTTYAYDSMDRLTRTTDPLNNVTTTAYDLDSNVTMTQDALGNRTTYAYDALDRQTAMITPSGGITTTAYDANSNVTKTVDPLGNVTSYAYDALNRQTNMTDATGGVTTYAYDAVGNTTAITDPDANVTTYAYDSINRETKSIDPLGNVTTYAYNAASDLTSTIDRDGRTITNAYDADDRLTTQVWLNSSGTATNTLTYAYDADSDLTVAANNAGTYTMAYDKLGDMTVEAEPFGATLTMAYDAVGNRTQVNDSFGGVTTSAYDADDRLTEREFSNGTTPLSFDMSYTSRSQLASVTRYNSLTQNGGTEVGSSAYTYNAEGLLTNLQHNSGTSTGGNLFNTTYTYDLNDRLTSINQAGTTLVTYTYNALNELTGDTSSATPTYSYDANGNRTNPGDTIGTDNQISTDGTWTYTYDKEGNVTQKTDAAGDKWQYTYDNMNELVNATYTPHGTTVADISVTFVYDVFGDDIEQEATQNSVTTITKFAFDGTNAWAAMTSTNTLQTRYVYLDGSTTPVAQISSGGTVNGYLTDYEGSVRIIVNNSTGASVDNISYDAYGNILSESSPVAGEQAKYAGYWFLAQVDLYQTWARFYDPLTGSWMQQDPVGFAGGSTNLQEYVGNDPTGGTDPTGLIVYTDSAAAAGAYFDQVIAPELRAAGVTNLQTGYQVVSAYDDTLIQVKRVDYDPALVNEVWKVVLNLQAQAQAAELRGDTALAAQLRMRAGRLRVVFGGENTASIRLRIGDNGQLQGQKFNLQEYINARIRGIITCGTKFTPFGAVASITDVAMALGENTGELERSGTLAAMLVPGQPLVPGGTVVPGGTLNGSTPNGNSKQSAKPQHEYEIFDQKTGDVVKNGISGQPLNQNGSSPRANQQVNQWNKAEGPNTYDSRVVNQNVPGRQQALDNEAARSEALRNAGNSMSKHKRP